MYDCKRDGLRMKLISFIVGQRLALGLWKMDVRFKFLPIIFIIIVFLYKIVDND